MNGDAARASRPLLLASAGIGVIGASYGMARYGFGLLAPEISATFHLGHRSVGLLATASYVAYLATSISAGRSRSGRDRAPSWAPVASAPSRECSSPAPPAVRARSSSVSS